MSENTGEYDALLKELKEHNKKLNDETPSIIEEIGENTPDSKANNGPKNMEPEEKLTEENLSEFIFKKSQKLLDTSMAAVSDIGMYIGRGATAKEIEALSELIKSATSVIDTLNNINLENRKSKSAKEIKTMDIEAKKQLGKGKSEASVNVLVASREEIMKLIENNAKVISENEKSGAIDADFTETNK